MKGKNMCAKQVVNRKVVPKAIAAAAFGGIAPNLMSLAILLTAGDGMLPQHTYYLGLLIFALVGCAVCFFWQETDPRRAFYLGIGLPALIQVGVNDLDFSNPPNPESPIAYVDVRSGSPASMPFSLTSTARANQGTESETSPIYGRKVFLKIDPRFYTETSIRNQLAVLYYQKNQRSPSRIPIPLRPTFINEQKKGERTSNREFLLQLDIPVTAEKFRIQVEKAYSRLQTLSTTSGSTEQYRLQYIENKWSGLRRALGQRSASTYRTELHRTDPPLISFDNYATFTKNDGKYNWYKWEIFVDVDDTQLKKIDEVEYKLPGTSTSLTSEKGRSTKFMISKEGRSPFWIHAVVKHSKKKQTHIQYYLDLSKRKK